MNELEAVIKALNLFITNGIITKACSVEFSYDEIDNVVSVYFKREFDEFRIKMFSIAFGGDDSKSYKMLNAASRLIKYMMYAKDYKSNGPGGVVETYSKEMIINKNLDLLADVQDMPSNKYNSNNLSHRHNFANKQLSVAINSYGEVFKLGSMVAFRKHGSDMLGYIDAFKHEDDCNVYAEIKNNLVKIDRLSNVYSDAGIILVDYDR